MISLLNKNYLQRLFVKYKAVYGLAWSKRCKNEQEWDKVMEVWYDELKDFDLDVFKKGAIQSLKAYPDYPPNLIQLKALCSSFSKKEWPSLEKEEPIKRLAPDEIKKIKEIYIHAQVQNVPLGSSIHPVWDKTIITLGTRKFDPHVYAARKAYLLAIDEISAASLCKEDLYARIRYLREEIAYRKFQSMRLSSSRESKDPISLCKARSGYKDWIKDN